MFLHISECILLSHQNNANLLSKYFLVIGYLLIVVIRRAENSSTSLKFTFTPMHGVGGEPVQRAFRAFGHKDFIPVVEQMEPDPEFPTVSFPNPEEGKSALVRG